MSEYLADEKEQQTVMLVLGSILQEARAAPDGCSVFGQLLGEKVAEEAVSSGVFARVETAEAFTTAFFSAVFPWYFHFSPLPVLDPKTHKATVPLSPPGVAVCDKSDFIKMVHQMFLTVSERVLGCALKAALSGDGLVVFVGKG
ncbi:hypothetical protein NEDG_01221 [Nematocida displodere]|uniref:Uncharacterized protein n=1 Tax=Nematocida displodere TaxID=1805483 RepID=A0A177ED39_9MICR|nr:hypothetical protein NEDG_01221 [Nematocida displodere]